MCVFTREQVVDPHAVFLFRVNSERQTMKVHSVVLSVTSHIQEVPPDELVLANQKTRKCFRHISIYCCREQKRFGM